MTALNQIAAYLNTDADKVIKCEEWAKVYFVLVEGSRPRFVSKKVVKVVNKPLDMSILSKDGQDHHALRLLVTESVRRYNQEGNKKLTLDLARRRLGERFNQEDNQSIVRVEKACEILLQANVCVQVAGAYLLTDAGIRYGNMLIS